MANEFYIVTRVACLDAIDADCVAVCRIASLAPENAENSS